MSLAFLSMSKIFFRTLLAKNSSMVLQAYTHMSSHSASFTSDGLIPVMVFSRPCWISTFVTLRAHKLKLMLPSNFSTSNLGAVNLREPIITAVSKFWGNFVNRNQSLYLLHSRCAHQLKTPTAMGATQRKICYENTMKSTSGKRRENPGNFGSSRVLAR